MLKVAVCWSGLIRVLPDVVSFNKQLFDDICNDANNEIEIDHFCQFWNKNNKYPYDFDQTLFDTQFKELDGIETENLEHAYKIIDILDPKTTVFTDFNSMGTKLLGKRFLSLDPKFAEYKNTAAQSGMFIHKTESDITNNIIDFREEWGYDVHHRYCRIIKHLAQFYAFEQVVSLAKQYDKDYDVIIRMRYDVVLAPDYISGLITSIYKTEYDNSILVGWFELPNYKNGVDTNTTFMYSTNIQTAIDTGKKWCIADPFFIGSAACMYKLADNIFDNSYTYYCYSDDKHLLHAEQLWFNEICNKHVACNASDNSMQYIILRDATELDIFKKFNCDVVTYRAEHKHKSPKHMGDPLDVIRSDPRRYVILPDNYILASMLKLILRY
jgi:hypothetical protein